MGRYAREDAGTPEVVAVLRSLQPGNLLQRIHAWIRAHVRFVTDARNAQAASLWNPAEVELLIRPCDLLRMDDPSGDCDDFSMLTAALLMAAGQHAEFVTIAANPDHPDTWSHVYVQTRTPWGAVAMDTSHGPAPGWEYPRPFRKQTWPTGERSMQLSGDENWGESSQAAGTSPAGIPWGNILTSGFSTAGNILSARYGQPPAGTYKQTGANGESVYYRQQTGDTTIPFFPTSSTGNSSTLMLLGLAAIAILIISSKS